MTKILVIKAHPLTEDESSTIRLLNTFLRAYQEYHPNEQIEVIDLFKHEIPSIDEQLLTTFNAKGQLTKEQLQLQELIDYYTNQFIESDKVIIANPLWNSMVPSHLKQWIDTIAQSGKTFKYTENGPKALAPNKKILHLQSNGSPTYGNDLASKYIDTIFEFLGSSEIKHIYIDGKDIPAISNEAIQNGLNDAKDYAKEF